MKEPGMTWAAPTIPPTSEVRLDTLRRQAEKAESKGQLCYASQKRSAAREIYATLGFRQEHLPEWAAERPRGASSLDYEARSKLYRQAEREAEEAREVAIESYFQEENDYRNAQETVLQQWYDAHGETFFGYLHRFPQFDNLVMWDGLRRLAQAWSTAKYDSGHPLPCPLPPACGRADFLASLPPGTPDLGKADNGRQVLQDDLTI